ncbi:carboxypeptidase-like regulatory domain-containing protein [Spongiimicrobium salis]|uniref:carboxypeptidase-like regulatory domain-containing protein n=1 Tax=Spongiimicrobium salis TaxID=1667022 RepID=UPI00374DDACA
MASAQNTVKSLRGQITSETKDVSDIHVINSTSKTATISDSKGMFSISVKRNDTIWFSAIQYKRTFLIVDQKVWDSEGITVPMEEANVELNEVVVRPYNLSGNIEADIQNLKIGPVITASTLGLPNANVKPLTKNERNLFTAMTEQGLHRLLDEITGHNKRLRKLVSQDENELRIKTAREFYPDSIYSQQLKIPSEKIYDFIYFCAVDSTFKEQVETQDKLKFLRFLEKKSIVYRKNNDLD